jgi:hypothetical protein
MLVCARVRRAPRCLNAGAYGSPAVSVGAANPHPPASPLHLPTQPRTRPVRAFPTFRLSIRQRVYRRFRPAHPLRPIAGGLVTDDESSRVLPAADDVRPVIVDCAMADSAR